MCGNPCCLTGRRAEKCSWINHVPNSRLSWRKWHRLTRGQISSGEVTAEPPEGAGIRIVPSLHRFCWITGARSCQCPRLQLPPLRLVNTLAPYAKGSAVWRAVKGTTGTPPWEQRAAAFPRLSSSGERFYRQHLCGLPDLTVVLFHV